MSIDFQVYLGESNKFNHASTLIIICLPIQSNARTKGSLCNYASVIHICNHFGSALRKQAACVNFASYLDFIVLIAGEDLLNILMEQQKRIIRGRSYRDERQLCVTYFI